jgi:hypothetical protein
MLQRSHTGDLSTRRHRGGPTDGARSVRRSRPRPVLALAVAVAASGAFALAPLGCGRTIGSIDASDRGGDRPTVGDASNDPRSATLGSRSDRVDGIAPTTLGPWLRVEIAGGITWINLERVESIQIPSRINPVGRLPILVVHYGSGRTVELAFDDETDRRAALERLQGGIRECRPR